MTALLVVADHSEIDPEFAQFADATLFLCNPTDSQLAAIKGTKAAIKALDDVGRLQVRNLHGSALQVGDWTFTGFHHSARIQDTDSRQYVSPQQAADAIKLLHTSDFTLTSVHPEAGGFAQLLKTATTVVCAGSQTTLGKNLWTVKDYALFSDISGQWQVQLPAQSAALYRSPFAKEPDLKPISAQQVTIGEDMSVTVQSSHRRKRKKTV